MVMLRVVQLLAVPNVTVPTRIIDTACTVDYTHRRLCNGRVSVCLSRRSTAAAARGRFAAERGRGQQMSIDIC